MNLTPINKVLCQTPNGEILVPEYYKYLGLDDIIYLDEETGEVKTERWLPVVDYETEYHVSDLGRLKSIGRKMPRMDKYGNSSYISVKGKIKKQYLRPDGYLVCGVRDGWYVKLHQAVAKAFICNPENKLTVNHIWGLKKDNRRVMLEWATFGEQNSHAQRVLGKSNPMRGKKGKLCKFSVPVICINDGKEYSSMTEAATKYMVSVSQISCNIRHPCRVPAVRGYQFILKEVVNG